MELKKIEGILSNRLKRILSTIKNPKDLTEIRLRINQPILLDYEHQELFVNQDFHLTKSEDKLLITHKEDIDEILEYISKHSLYAYEDEIRNGFITIEGGHRIGLTGKVVLEGRKIKTIRNISGLNIRISHQVTGCANQTIPYLFENGKLLHTLIISPPKFGKTTLLRDIIRQLSDGTIYGAGMNVGVVDERSEIGGCYRGIPQNDLGKRTDILDGCNKPEGMSLLIRAMAPRVLALDEIGTKDDIEALEFAIHSGCTIICTIHGATIEEVMRKPRIKELFHQGIFGRYILLQSFQSEKPWQSIYNENQELIQELLAKEVVQ